MMKKIIIGILTFFNIFKHQQGCQNNRILFLRLDNKVGDTVIESFFIRELKKFNPLIKIDVVMLEPYVKIIENNPYINKIYSIPFGKKKWIKAFCLITKLRKQKYDLVVDIPSKTNLKRLLYLILINPKTFMTTNTEYVKFTNYVIDWKKDAHTSTVFLKALNLLGIKGIDTHYELFISDEDKEYVKNFINENNINNKKIFVFNPNGSTTTRSLNKENIEKILKYLQKYKKYSTILLDYKKEFDDFKSLAVIFTSNNIMQVSALIEKSDYVFTTDTGIVHIADVYLKSMTVLYSDIRKEGEKPRDYDYITEWGSINPTTKMLRNKNDVNYINMEDICSVLDKELK